MLHGLHGIIGKDSQFNVIPHFLLDFFGHTYGRLTAPSPGISAVKHYHINHLLRLLSMYNHKLFF